MGKTSLDSVILPILFIISSQVVSVLSRAKCSLGEYRDKFLNLCRKCSDCCPPRPVNDFCRKRCNLREICNLSEPTPSISSLEASDGANINYVVSGVLVGLSVALVLGLILLFRVLWKSNKGGKNMMQPNQAPSESEGILTTEEGESKPKEMQDH